MYCSIRATCNTHFQNEWKPIGDNQKSTRWSELSQSNMSICALPMYRKIKTTQFKTKHKSVFHSIFSFFLDRPKYSLIFFGDSSMETKQIVLHCIIINYHRLHLLERCVNCWYRYEKKREWKRTESVYWLLITDRQVSWKLLSSKQFVYHEVYWYSLYIMLYILLTTSKIQRQKCLNQVFTGFCTCVYVDSQQCGCDWMNQRPNKRNFDIQLKLVTKVYKHHYIIVKYCTLLHSEYIPFFLLSNLFERNLILLFLDFYFIGNIFYIYIIIKN